MQNQFAEARKQFPILKNNIQLSSCSQSALHLDVKNAINNYVNSWEKEGMDWESWMNACENARLEFAKMINAEVSEISIVSSVSHAVSSIATSMMHFDKKKVLITDFDFPTVGHVWLSHKDTYDIQFIDQYQDDFIQTEDYLRYLDNETLLVSTSHVSFYDGYKQDLKKLSELVHANGSYLFVDAYQSLGQTVIDVKDMDIDILCSGLQKYGLGIPGIAFLYIKKEIAQHITPKITGWFGQSNPFLFDIKNIDYAVNAKRFDSGTFPMINGFAAEAGLKVLNQFNMSDIEAYLERLSKVAIEEAESWGLTVKSPKNVKAKGSNTAILVERASEVEQILKKQGFIVSARNDVIRIAPHFYNTEQDVRLTIGALAKVIKQKMLT